MKINEITEMIIGFAIKVHKKLGPGFLESVYQSALEYEFKNNNVKCEKEKSMAVRYGDVFLEPAFRCDFLVEDKVILECKTTKTIK